MVLVDTQREAKPKRALAPVTAGATPDGHKGRIRLSVFG